MNISAKEGKEKVAAGALLLDVRTPAEFKRGHVPGAINIPHDQVLQHLGELGPDKARVIVTYCGHAPRAIAAQRALASAGYKNVFSAGGYRDWCES